ncbi:segregation and condensation protein A [Methylomicrobium lacus]|uniref:segregation and condensation protein A n=1 Tax=Methylomicrobium lacus TaxID=136992 RepID=UPI00045E9D95|nr:ScpA family protein [Methylomicrobium lacus]
MNDLSHDFVPERAAVLAIVNGEPIEQLPDDLYIPPNALEVFLELFEGPLDLLLYLIRRQNLDIVEVSIANVTHQYISYIQMMSEMNLELAAEYLVMAALLAEIKSRMLLPRQQEAEEDEADPRATLIRRLQEYECIKKAAEEIELMPRLERELFTCVADTSNLTFEKKLPDVTMQELLQALQQVLKRAEQFSHHQVVLEPLSVRERMTTILDNLKGAESLRFTELFLYKEGRPGVLVAFLAILELAKEGLIEIIQLEPFAEITVRGAAAATPN